MPRPYHPTSLLFVLLCLPLLPASWPGSVQAADDSLPTHGPAGVIEEVLVTARRREEPLQVVPISMAALGGPELRLRQIRSADQLGAIVPNLAFEPDAPSSGSSSVAQIFIRGIGQTDFTPVTDPGVALYLDGVYLARAPGNVLDLVDVDRIEVLRGPQGTLFGRNAIGGAIKVHTRRPDFDAFAGSLETRVGTDDLLAFTLKLNQPFTDDLAGNLLAYSERRDGYVERITDGVRTGDRDRQGVRAALNWNASDSLGLFLVVDATRIDENGAPTVSGGVDDRQPFATFGNGLLPGCEAVRINPGFDATPGSGPPSFPPPGVGTGGAPGCYGPDSVPGPYVSEGTYPVASELDSAGVALEIDWDLGDAWRLLSTTGLRSMSLFSSRDGDNTPANIFATRDDYDHEQLSQELQLHFDAGGSLQAVLGAYAFTEDGFDKVDVTLPTGAIRSGGFYDNRSWALFGQGSWDFGERFTASLGLRHTEDRKTFTPDQYVQGDASMGGETGFYDPTWPLLAGTYLGPTGPLPAGTRILAFQENDADFDHTDVNADLRVQLTDDLMAYLTYATGYKSGGFDQRFVGPTPDGVPSSYEPETVESVELGAKGTALGGRLRWNLAIFEADYDDLQIIVRESFNPLTVNAGRARVRGGEFEADWLIGEGGSLRLAVGHLDTGYRELSEAAQASGVTLDNELVNAPAWTVSTGLAWAFTLDRGGQLTPRLDWNWTDDAWNDAVNSALIRQDAHHLLNAALAWDLPGGHWQFLAAVRNALDERWMVTGNSAFGTAAAYVERVWARPREWQLSVRYAF